jgi:hypothetical protein
LSPGSSGDVGRSNLGTFSDPLKFSIPALTLNNSESRIFVVVKREAWFGGSQGDQNSRFRSFGLSKPTAMTPAGHRIRGNRMRFGAILFPIVKFEIILLDGRERVIESSSSIGFHITYPTTILI